MFNPIKTLIAATLLTAAASLPLSAQTQEPMMTFHTQRYDMVGAENVFSIALGAIEDTYVDIDFGFGPVEYKIGSADFDVNTGEINGTIISGQVSEDGIVKIYGNPLAID